MSIHSRWDGSEGRGGRLALFLLAPAACRLLLWLFPTLAAAAMARRTTPRQRPRRSIPLIWLRACGHERRAVGAGGAGGGATGSPGGNSAALRAHARLGQCDTRCDPGLFARRPGAPARRARPDVGDVGGRRGRAGAAMGRRPAAPDRGARDGAPPSAAAELASRAP